MNQAHIVLIDTHGAIIDYRVDAETLAAVFTQLQAAGERMPFPVIKPEFLTGDSQPAPVAPSAQPEPEVPDTTPLYVGAWWRVFRGLASDFVEVEFNSKPIPYIRQELRDNGYRWNHKTKRWYGPEISLPAWLTGAEEMHIPVTVEPEPEVVDPLADIPTIGGSGSRCAPVTFDQPVSTLPDPGTVVRLTGGFDEPSIARGDSWTDSIVKQKPDESAADEDDAFLASLNDLFKGS